MGVNRAVIVHDRKIEPIYLHIIGRKRFHVERTACAPHSGAGAKLTPMHGSDHCAPEILDYPDISDAHFASPAHSTEHVTLVCLINTGTYQGSRPV